MAGNVEDFSGTFTRLRAETVGTSVLCWAISAWSIDLKRVPFVGLDLATPPPRGALYVLALCFFLYCVAAFVLRYFNEARYSTDNWQAKQTLMGRMEGTQQQMNSVQASLEKFFAAPPESSPIERIKPAIKTLQEGLSEIKEIRFLVAGVRTSIAFERSVIAFGLPLTVSCVLIAASLWEGHQLISLGLDYIVHPSQWTVP